MRLFSAVRPSASIALAIAVVFLLPVGVHALTDSKEGTVMVRVCPEPDQPYLTLDAPKSGDVIHNGTAVVRGTIAYISEIHVTVDDIHQTTIETGDSADSFEQPISLASGSHDIKVEAYDICGSMVDEAAVSVTVPARQQPPLPRTEGGSTADTPEASQNTASQEGEGESAVIFHEPVVYQGSTPLGIAAKQIPVPDGNGAISVDAGSKNGRELSLLDAIITELDLESIFRDIGTITRSLTALAGTALLLVPQVFTHLLANVPAIGPGVAPGQKPGKGGRRTKPSRIGHSYSGDYRLYALRVLGACLVLAVFVV